MKERKINHRLRTGEMKMSFITKAINIGEYVLVRHEGQLNTPEFEEARLSAKRILNEYHWNRLLVDLRGVINRVSLADVYYFMESNTRVLPFIKIGLLFPPEREENGRFAEQVASNRGVHLKSFVDYEQAVAWLTGKQTIRLAAAPYESPPSARTRTSDT
jgi:hypothetical protein